jgi:glycerol uptake facilitator-like aquaporin
MSLAKRAAAEGIGTAFLVAAVVGSGIMGERLSDANPAITLLANSLATGGALVALILAFGPISGAHFNPVVSLVVRMRRELAGGETLAYVAMQVVGGLAGVVAAHLMFGEPMFSQSLHARAGTAQLFSECIATFGLIAVVLGCSRTRPVAMPYAVAAYITSAYWFTGSTSFANPAVTLARSLTDSFSGIRPYDVVPFVAAQVIGGLLAAKTFGWFQHSSSITPKT